MYPSASTVCELYLDSCDKYGNGGLMPNLDKSELDDGQKLTLYVVNKAPNGVPTKTHYQKMMYLVLKAMGNDPRVAALYRPHHFGPYSDMADEWRESLIQSGWLDKNSKERVSVPPSVKKDVDKLRISDSYTDLKVDSIVRFISSLTTDEVLLYIYTEDVNKNEGMTDQSDIKDRIFSNRVNIALSMVRSGKVSIEKGAELADADLADFMLLLRKGASV